MQDAKQSRLDRAGDKVHRVVFSVWTEILIILLTVIGLIISPSPWFVMLTIINIYQLWILTPLAWGDKANDRKLDKIIEILEYGKNK